MDEEEEEYCKQTDHDLFVIGNRSDNPFSIRVGIGGKNYAMQVDTGAAVSCISEQMYAQEFASYGLRKDYITLKTYVGECISPKGYIRMNVKFNDRFNFCKFYVVPGGGPPLLGRDWIAIFGLKLESINAVTTGGSNIVDELVRQYPSVFSNSLGCFRYAKVSLRLKPDARPVFCRPRQVPFAYRDKLDQELERLEQLKVITPIESSQWGTPLVVVIKNNGGLRVCGNYKTTLNKYLVDINYPLPRIEEMFAKLHGGKLFTKIDLNQAYTQFEVDEESAKLLTWSTHRGLYRVNRMMYGISPASSVFQRHIEQLFQGVPNVVCFQDDILITGRDMEEHMETLKVVLGRLSDAGLTVSKEKCEFFRQEVEYLGHVISKDGLRKSEDKIRAIRRAKTPSNATEIRAWCGMVNYYARFVPGLAAELSPFYKLLKKDVRFGWGAEQEVAFERVKEILLSDAALVHFDPKLPLILTTDASQLGISAVLSHLMSNGEQRMIGCISRTLMPAEKNYSVIHREALSIYYGVYKFQHYLIGREFTIQTDHKALMHLFGEERGIPQMHASRIQRWALFLSGFNYKIQYIRGKDNVIADAFSRVPAQVKVNSPEFGDQGNFVNFASCQEDWPLNGEEIARETEKDVTLAKVEKYISKEWPKKIPENLTTYFGKRKEIRSEQGMLLWGHRIIIPTSLRERLLKELHAGHFGIVRMKSKASSLFWWPYINRNIEQVTSSCIPCLHSRQDPPKMKPMPWRITSRPWERVHLDYLGPIKGIMYLIAVDAYSKWVEVFPMKSMNADALEERLREMFSRFGLPEMVVTDNGRSFVSNQIATFLKINGVIHRTSPVAHAQSNGLAENGVKTFKSKIYAEMMDRRNDGKPTTTIISRYLISYRNTIHSATKETPAKRMLGREIRTTLSLLREREDMVKVKRTRMKHTVQG